jgi:nucleotide-binding universal stress UspA family protein
MLRIMLRPHDPRPLKILVAHDGSADAAAAVELTAATFPGARTTVLSVWEPLIGAALRLRPETATMKIALRAAQHACSLGLAAEPRWTAGVTDVGRAIVDEAEREQAALIVTGRRGLAGDRSSPQGRVARNVLRNADRPVLVVPSAQTAEPPRAARGEPFADRTFPAGGLRVQVFPLEEV